jgi:hypothetical protein
VTAAINGMRGLPAIGYTISYVCGEDNIVHPGRINVDNHHAGSELQAATYNATDRLF